MKLRFLVDVDDTICRTQPAFIDLLARLSGVTYAWEEFDGGDHSSRVPLDVRVSMWREIDTTPGWVEGLPEAPGCQEFLAELRKMGDVVALTSPHFGPLWMPERVKWLQARGFAKRDIIFASSKHFVLGHVFFDDHPGHITRWSEAHAVMNRGPRAVLIETPPTKRFTAPGEGWRWHRAKDLRGALVHAEAQARNLRGPSR